MGIKINNKYVKEIEKNGFVIIKNLISKNECDKFKKLLENYHKKYHSHCRVGLMDYTTKEKNLKAKEKLKI